jgi:hypothetical protein
VSLISFHGSAHLVGGSYTSINQTEGHLFLKNCKARLIKTSGNVFLTDSECASILDAGGEVRGTRARIEALLAASGPIILNCCELLHELVSSRFVKLDSCHQISSIWAEGNVTLRHCRNVLTVSTEAGLTLVGTSVFVSAKANRINAFVESKIFCALELCEGKFSLRKSQVNVLKLNRDSGGKVRIHLYDSSIHFLDASKRPGRVFLHGNSTLYRFKGNITIIHKEDAL